jgi:adenylyl-sulfate kinase
MHAAPVFWFTGLSGAGKTKLAEAACGSLRPEGYAIEVLDGDDIRSVYHVDLGFSAADITTNNALIADLCAERRRRCDAVLVPIISPFRASRKAARQKLQPGFFEIYISANLDTVVKRDVKGLYEKAQRNEITNMIGFHEDSPYEPPEHPDLVVPSGSWPVDDCAALLVDYIRHRLPAQLNPRIVQASD